MSDIEFPTPPVRMSQLNAALIDHLPKQDIIGPLNVPSNLQEEDNDHKSILSQEHSPLKQPSFLASWRSAVVTRQG